MGRACRAHGGDDMLTPFSLETLVAEDRSEDVDVDGRIILKWIRGIYG
jgi:hypothetical protein